MTLYERIQQVKLGALKARDSDTVTSLGTVLGEAKLIATKKENRDPTDEEVIGVIKKTLEGIAERLAYEKDDFKKAAMVLERAGLQVFMPTQLSDTEVRVLIENSGLRDVKTIMQFFKANYAGKYDGKQVSEIVKSFLKPVG